jgi:DNA-binding MarR family transcriptional regulator
MKIMRLTVEDPFGKFVHLTERLLVNRLQRNFRAAGYSITAEQWHVLINLWEQDGQTQQQLSEKTEKDKGNITRLISGLEKRNILVRIPNYSDGRSKLIYLTSKGKEYQKALIQIAQKTLYQAQANIPNNEIDICNSVLQKVVNNLRD